MDPTAISIGIASGAGALGLLIGYLVGRMTGKRAEHRRWQGQMASEARKVGKTLANVRRALKGDALKPNG
jgi:hypothetical protein